MAQGQRYSLGGGGAAVDAANTWTADQTFNDSVNLTFGTGGDVDIDYNGTDLVLNLTVVGSGDMVITGGSAEFDDAEGVRFGAGKDTELRWSTGDADNHSLVLALGNSNQGLHITDLGAVATDWNIAATTHPNIYVHSNTTPATDYLRLGGHDGTAATVDVVGGTTLRLQIAGSTTLSITGDEVAIADNDKFALGSGNDADIYYDGTNLIIEPRVVGSGHLVINDACMILLNDTTNAQMTTGLTINQGANDDEIIAFKSSGVAHGVTGVTETDTYGFIKKVVGEYGGLDIYGITEITPALQLQGVGTTEDQTKSTGAAATVEILAGLKSGTGVGNLGTADSNMLVIRQNDGTTRYIFDIEGSAHADVEWVAFDEYDDLALVRDFQSILTDKFGPSMIYNLETFEKARIIGRNSMHIEHREDGRVQLRGMVDFHRLAMLHHGTLIEVGERLGGLEEKLGDLEEESRMLKSKIHALGGT